MFSPLDYFIFGGFFVLLFYRTVSDFGSIKSINSYSIGRRSFTTFALGATITATWVSGSGFLLDLEEFQKDGLLYLLPSLCMILCLVVIAVAIVPKMERFLGKTSVATIMYEEYGQVVRIITAIAGILAMCGGISIQFKIMGNVGNYFFPEYSNFIWSCVFAAVLIAYAFLGGIKSVVYTDIIQSFCFSISIIFIIYSLGSQNTHDLDLSKFDVFSLAETPYSKASDAILLGLYFLIPGMSPTTVQRISMGITVKQVKKSHLYSALMILLVMLLSCYVSFLIYIKNQGNLDANVTQSLLNSFIAPGTKAIAVIGIVSMCMSTADSNLNVTSVLLANDTYKSRTWNEADKLLVARRYTILIGVISLLFLFYQKGILETILFSRSFYVPIVSFPLLSMIFGLKTTPRCVLIAMFAGAFYFFIHKVIFNWRLQPIVFAFLCNGLFLFLSHYIIEKWNLLACIGIKSQLNKE